MTPLSKILRRRIAATGPMTLAEVMAELLMHPDHGYYASRDPFGVHGDFTTAPEISQMYGELVGLALAQAWLDQGAPGSVTLAELGPGRGTLMADLCRATGRVPGFAEAAHVHLVERSAKLRAVQAQSVETGTTWHDEVADLPDDRPLYLIANEFLDALPVRQFQRAQEGWREVVVTLDADALSFGLATPTPLAALSHRFEETGPGDVVETCPALPGIVSQIATRIGAHGGCALIVDYGGWRSLGDTVQAVRGHRPVPILDRPGESDLTAHVDFEAVVAAARSAGAEAWGPIGQGAWLGALGIGARAEVLARGMDDPKLLEEHRAAFHRLTAAEEMGTVFQAMAIVPRLGPAPPGFPAIAPAAAPTDGPGPGPVGVSDDP